jgi:two-component system KDP operon response regulator KdpE
MTRVLVVDDEPQILRALQINLHARGYDVVTADTGAAALHAAAADKPDLVVLDLGLPDVDGIEVIRRLRSWTSVPIVILSGRMDSGQKVEALDAGADDYVTKPFNVDEILARIRAVTRRRTPTEPPAIVRIGRYSVDLAKLRVHRTDQPDVTVHLTRTEWQLLDVLLRNQGKLIGQRQLLQQVWGPTPTVRPTPLNCRTCASTWPTCAANWKTTRPGRGTSLPSWAWAIVSCRSEREGMDVRCSVSERIVHGGEW